MYEPIGFMDVSNSRNLFVEVFPFQLKTSNYSRLTAVMRFKRSSLFFCCNFHASYKFHLTSPVDLTRTLTIDCSHLLTASAAAVVDGEIKWTAGEIRALVFRRRFRSKPTKLRRRLRWPASSEAAELDLFRSICRPMQVAFSRKRPQPSPLSSRCFTSLIYRYDRTMPVALIINHAPEISGAIQCKCVGPPYCRAEMYAGRVVYAAPWWVTVSMHRWRDIITYFPEFTEVTWLWTHPSWE